MDADGLDKETLQKFGELFEAISDQPRCQYEMNNFSEYVSEVMVVTYEYGTNSPPPPPLASSNTVCPVVTKWS